MILWIPATSWQVTKFLDGDISIMLKDEFLRLARFVDSYSSLNYSKKRKHFTQDVEKFLNRRVDQPL